MFGPIGKGMRFLRQPNRRKRLVLEAAWFLTRARLAIALLPFRRVRAMLERPPQHGPENRDQDTIETTRHVARALDSAARNLPWRCNCLVRAAAGRWMLDRRGIACRLTVGVAKREGEAMRSHAWLHSGEVLVTGGEHEDFHPITDFGGGGD